MKEWRRSLTALLLVAVLAVGAAPTTIRATGGQNISDYEWENLNQMVVQTPQEEIAPPGTALPSVDMSLMDGIGGLGDSAAESGPGAEADLSSTAEQNLRSPAGGADRDESRYSSPLSVTAAGSSVFTADYTAKCIRAVGLDSGLEERSILLPKQPGVVKCSPDGTKLYAGAGGADGSIYEIDTATGTILHTFEAGHTPSALEFSADGAQLYIANRFDGTLQVVDLASGETTATVPVTREPMSIVRAGTKLYLASHLITGSTAQDVVSSDVICIDLATWNGSAEPQMKTIKLLNGSTNVKAMAASPDGDYIYISHALGRYNVATTQADRGWIYNNAMTEIRVSDNTVTAVMLLDDLDWGAGNPWGIAVTDTQIFVAISGTGELMAIDRAKMRAKIDAVADGSFWRGKNQALSYQGYLQNRDDIANDLTFLTEMKTRIPLKQDGPRGIAVYGGKVWTANYFSGSLSAVGEKDFSVKTTSFLTAEEDDIRTGERLWNDATIGYQQWQSCASCHPDARADGLNWDNLNDGIGTPKQARSMLYTFERGRVMATGIRANAKVAVRAGLKYIMFNANYPEEGLLKIDAYLQSLKPEPSPLLVGGRLNESAMRGKALFEGDAGCAKCHAGQLKGKDALIYNYTQTGNESRGLLVPSLVESWRTAPYLCDGRAATVKDVLTTCNPGYRSGKGVHGSVSSLSDSQLDDLTNYVMSLSTEKDSGVQLQSSTLGFPVAEEGYQPQETRTVLITNAGITALQGLKAELQKDMESDFEIFLSKSVLEPGEAAELNVLPKTDLAKGIHGDTAVISCRAGELEAVTLWFAVKGGTTFNGTLQVGETLAIAEEAQQKEYSYQWYRGVNEERMLPISGADGSRYLLTKADDGMVIQAAAFFHGEQVLTSEVSGPVGGAEGTVALAADGLLKVGGILTAKVTGTSNTLQFTWYVDGQIVGSGPEYVVRQEDVGKRIHLSAANNLTGKTLSVTTAIVAGDGETAVRVKVTDESGSPISGAEVTCEALQENTLPENPLLTGTLPENALAGNVPLKNSSLKNVLAANVPAGNITTEIAAVQTGIDGAAILTLGEGSYLLTAQKDAKSSSVEVAVTSEDINAGLKEAVLTIARGPYFTISGAAVTAGLYGVKAELVDSGGQTAAVSDLRGKAQKTFSFTAPEGMYTLRLTKPGHLSCTISEISLTQDIWIEGELPLIPGKVRGSGNRINFADIAAMSGAFAGLYRAGDQPDVDGDGFFTAQDLWYVRENYGKTAVSLTWPYWAAGGWNGESSYEKAKK